MPTKHSGAKRDAGATDPIAALVEVAGELGYEVDAGQAASFFTKAGNGLDKLSDKDLDEVAGGYLLLRETSGMHHDEVIDDKTGDVLEKGLWMGYDECNARADAWGVSHRHITWEELFRLRETGSIYA